MELAFCGLIPVIVVILFPFNLQCFTEGLGEANLQFPSGSVIKFKLFLFG